MIDIVESNVPLEHAIEKFLSPADLEQISNKSNHASQILGLQSRRLKELRKQGFLEVFEHVELERMLAELYTLQGKCERIKNFPYPRQFATLNYIFVWLFIFLLPYGLMEEFEKIGDHIVSDHTAHEAAMIELHSLWTLFGKHFIWFSIPFSATVSWVFYALEVVGEHSENPFEGGPNDIPITNLCRNIEIDIRQLIDDDGVPEPLTWNDGVVL